jgi:DNA-binding response OmpR family regulator
LEDQLKAAGFDVVFASNGAGAMREIEVDVTRFACLVTDIRLPLCDGWAIAKRARLLAPSLPVIYMTGDSADQWQANGVSDSTLIAKPFDVDELISAISQRVWPV